MDLVQPRKIESPWTGEQCLPQIKVRDYGDQLITEAWWYCPTTGQFIGKGVVKVEPKEKITKPSL